VGKTHTSGMGKESTTGNLVNQKNRGGKHGSTCKRKPTSKGDKTVWVKLRNGPDKQIELTTIKQKKKKRKQGGGRGFNGFLSKFVKKGGVKGGLKNVPLK